MTRKILTSENVAGSRPICGMYICRSCGSVRQNRIIDSSAGSVHVDTRLHREECPNGHGLMDQRTEADVIASYEDALQAADARVEALEHSALRWHHGALATPDDDSHTLMVAYRHHGLHLSPAVYFHDQVRPWVHPTGDYAIEGVYAWARLPEPPPEVPR